MNIISYVFVLSLFSFDDMLCKKTVKQCVFAFTYVLQKTSVKVFVKGNDFVSCRFLVKITHKFMQASAPEVVEACMHLVSLWRFYAREVKSLLLSLFLYTFFKILSCYHKKWTSEMCDFLGKQKYASFGTGSCVSIGACSWYACVWRKWPTNRINLPLTQHFLCKTLIYYYINYITYTLINIYK